VLWLYKGEFEAAQEILDSLSGEGFVNEDLISGLACRFCVLPDAKPGRSPESAHDLIRRAGWAELLSAQKNLPKLNANTIVSAWIFPTRQMFTWRMADTF